MKPPVGRGGAEAKDTHTHKGPRGEGKGGNQGCPMDIKKGHICAISGVCFVRISDFDVIYDKSLIEMNVLKRLHLLQCHTKRLEI